MSTRFQNSTFHSLEYYKRCIECIVKSLSVGAKKRQIADELNKEGILTSSGLPFTAERVSWVLRSLRARLDGESKIYLAMLELFFTEQLTKDQCSVLINRRAGAM